MNYPPLKSFLQRRITTPICFAGYQSKPAFLRDFEQKFVTGDALTLECRAAWKISPLSPARRRAICSEVMARISDGRKES